MRGETFPSQKIETFPSQRSQKVIFLSTDERFETWVKDTYCGDSKNNCRFIGVKTFTDIAPMNVPLMRRKAQFVK